VPSVPVLTNPLDASVKTGLEAVNEERIGCAVSVATPVTPSVPLKVIDAAPIVPVNVGLALITTLPVPVIALLTSPLLPSLNTGSEAVNVDTIGLAVKVATPVTPSVPPINTFLAIPTPPLTISAPVVVLVLSVVSEMVTAPVIMPPVSRK